MAWKLQGSTDMPDMTKEEKQILLVLAALIVLGLIFYILTHLPMRQNIDTTTMIDTPSGNNTETLSVPEILIHVSGAVKKPGVYKVPAAARVWEAVVAAGGPLSGADLDKVNLSKVLNDGEKIMIAFCQNNIPAISNKKMNGRNAKKSLSSANTSSAKVNLNTATAEELDTLPGIGPATAKKMIAQREKGPFLSIDDLQKVKGLKKKTVETLRDLVEI